MATIAAPSPATTPAVRERTQHPLLSPRREAARGGIPTLIVVSIIIFWATEVLPGQCRLRDPRPLGHARRLHASRGPDGARQGHLRPVLVLGLGTAHRQARHLARERRLGLEHRRATARRLGGARGPDHRCDRDHPWHRARRLRRTSQGQAVRPRLLDLRPRHDVPPRVRRRDHPHHLVRHRRVPRAAGGLARFRPAPTRGTSRRR